MTKPRIYFDIDKTMVDTKRMLENIQRSVEPVGISSDVFVSTINQYLSTLQSKTYFDPEEVIQRLLIAAKVHDEEALRGAIWKPANFSQALFPEVLEVLDTLKPSVELGVFSQGVKYWQERKLELADLSPFFPEELRIIADNKLRDESLGRLQPNSWVIDDKEDVVKYLRKQRPDLTVLRIDRSPSQAGEQGSITSLKEVVTFSRD